MDDRVVLDGGRPGEDLEPLHAVGDPRPEAPNGQPRVHQLDDRAGGVLGLEQAWWVADLEGPYPAFGSVFEFRDVEEARGQDAPELLPPSLAALRSDCREGFDVGRTAFLVFAGKGSDAVGRDGVEALLDLGDLRPVQAES